MTNMASTLQEIAGPYDIYSPYQYPWMAFNFFLAYWSVSLVLYGGHRRFSQLFREPQRLEEYKKRNVVTYIIQLVATTVALICQIYGGVDLLFRGQDTTTPERLQACILAIYIICSLYAWELIYRINIGIPLLLHHIVTIIFIQIGYCSFYDTGSLWYFRYGVLLCFYATTEQASFIALYCYRMELFPPETNYLRNLFYFSAAQTFAAKTVVSVALLVYFIMGIKDGTFEGSSWGTFWKVTFPPLLLTLYFVQVYSARILMTLGRRCGVNTKTVEEDVSDLENPRMPDATKEEGPRDLVDTTEPTDDQVDRHVQTSLGYDTVLSC